MLDDPRRGVLVEHQRMFGDNPQVSQLQFQAVGQRRPPSRRWPRNKHDLDSSANCTNKADRNGNKPLQQFIPVDVRLFYRSSSSTRLQFQFQTGFMGLQNCPLSRLYPGEVVQAPLNLNYCREQTRNLFIVSKCFPVGFFSVGQFGPGNANLILLGSQRV